MCLAKIILGETYYTREGNEAKITGVINDGDKHWTGEIADYDGSTRNMAWKIDGHINPDNAPHGDDLEGEPRAA